MLRLLRLLGIKTPRYNAVCYAVTAVTPVFQVGGESFSFSHLPPPHARSRSVRSSRETSEHPHDLQLSTPIYSYLQFKTPIAGGNLIFFRFVLRFLSLRFSASTRFEPSASSDKGYQSLSKVIKASSSSSCSGLSCRSFRAATRTKPPKRAQTRQTAQSHHHLPSATLSLRLPADSR